MIAVSSSGKSFRALAAYLANGRTGEEQDRVAWTLGRNLPTGDPQLAATFMRATAGRSDRVEKPVYHIALSFDPGDPVDRATMERVAARVLERLGLAEHQAVIVAHRDRGHAHVHVLVNRVHPETGKAWERWQDQPVIQQVLREEERALGLREVTPSLQPREAEPREPPHSRVARLVQLLKDYQRCLELARERSAAQGTLASARARSAEVAAAEERTRAIEAGFRRALGKAYADPEQAYGAFTRLVDSKGLDEAVGTLRDHPERFGRLLTIERHRALGLVRIQDDHQARVMARSATLKAREAVQTARAARSVETDSAGAEKELERIAAHTASLSRQFARFHSRSELEYRIGRTMRGLLPREIERLKNLITNPQLVIAQRLRALLPEVALGRDENER